MILRLLAARPGPSGPGLVFMIYRPIIAAQASGSLGGTVFSHTRGTQYTRQRVTPIDPDTVEQENCRNAMTTLASLWNTEQDDASRAAWLRYSQQHPRPNRIGELRPIGGRAEYFRANLLRAQANQAIEDLLSITSDPPAHGAAIAPGAIALTIEDPGNPTFQCSWTTEQDWQASDQSALVIFISDAIPTTRYWFRGPYSLSWFQTGTPGQRDFSFTTTRPGPLDNTKRYFYRMRVTLADGSLSAPVQGIIPPYA